MPIDKNKFISSLRESLPEEYRGASDDALMSFALTFDNKLAKEEFVTFEQNDTKEQEEPGFLGGLWYPAKEFGYTSPKTAASIVNTVFSLFDSDFLTDEEKKRNANARLRWYESIDNITKDWMKDDVNLQAFQKWAADNPFEWGKFFTNPAMFSSTISSVMTSMATTIGAGAIGGLVGGPVGATAGAVSAGIALEGGEAYNEAYTRAKEAGYSDEEIDRIASESAATYGIAAGVLEAIVPLSVLGSIGFRAGKEGAKRGYINFTSMYIKNLVKGGKESAEEIAKRTVGEYALTNLSLAKKITTLGKALTIEPLAEATTEGVQYLTQQAIIDGKVDGEDIDAEWLLEKVKDPEFSASIAGGFFGAGPISTVGNVSEYRNQQKARGIVQKAVAFEQEQKKSKFEEDLDKQSKDINSEITDFAKEEGLSTEGIGREEEPEIQKQTTEPPKEVEKEPTLKTIIDEEKAAIKAAMDEGEEKFIAKKLSEDEMAFKLSQDIGEFGDEDILPKEANIDAYLSEGEEVLPPEAKKGMPKSMVEQILGKQTEEIKAEQLPPEAMASGNEWMAKALGLNIAEESKLEEKLSNEAKKNGSQYNKTITEADDELYQKDTNPASEQIKYNAQKYKETRKFLKKKYPSFKVELLDNVYNKYGDEVAGKIAGSLIQISKSKATVDTLPHEYIHPIIIALRDDPIVKLGIKKFSSALKTDITLDEVEKLSEKYFGKGGKANEEMLQLVAESSPERVEKILNLLDSLKKEPNTLENLNYNATLSGLRSLVTQAGGLATAPEWATKSVSDRRNAYQEEQLVQVLGEYVANRITDTTLRNRIRVWLKQLLAKVRKAFGMLKEEDIKVLIGERIYKGDVPGAVDTSGEYYQEVSDMENEESDTPDEHDTATDSGTFKDFKAIFSTIFSTNISAKQYRYIQDLAVEIFNNKTEQNNDNGFIEFKNYVEAYIQNEYASGNLERLYIPKEGKELIRYTNELKKMYLQANNKIPRYRGIREKARIYHDVIFDTKTKRVHSQEEAIDELTGRTIDLRDHSLKPLYMMKNLVEVRNSMDKTKDRINSIFLGYVQSYSLLDKYIYKKKGKEHVGFKDRWGGFTIKDLDALNDAPGNENIVFIGSKQGDNSSVIFAYTPLFMKGWTEEQSKKYLIEEIDKHVDKKYKKDVFNIFKDSAATFSKHGWRKMATQHHAFKTIFHNKYLNWQIEEKGLYDLFNRLRVALSEGIVPYGIGDSKVMLVKGKDITVRINGKEESMSLSDGWMLSGRQFMKRVEDIVGAVPEDNKQHGLGSFKGAIVARSENGEDYGMFKMLNSVPLENMELVKDGKVIAKYDSEKGIWIDSKGNEFDHVVSDNEAKVTAGKFKDALDSNEIMTIPEHAIMIQQIPSQKSKTSSAFPVNVSEMIWTVDENILNEFKKYYRQIANKYLTPLFKGIKEPKYLRELLYSESDNPSQLQKLMEIDESGNTIRLPGMIELASFILNHRIIRKGYFQARDKDNSSLAYLKPAFGMGLKNDEIAVSSENSIVYNRIKTLSKLSNVDEMNKWLEKNEVNIIVSRQPVAREDGVRAYRIKKLVSGGHADAVFMSFDVVTKVLDGDYDGDKVQLNFATKELVDAIKGLNKKFDEHNKPALTNIFKDNRGKRITASIEQVKKTIEEQGVGRYSQGIMVNAKVINGLLAYKGFKINYTVGSGKNQQRFSIRVKKPTDRVVMDYIELKDNITEKDIASGDKIITRNGKKYLETDLAHELSYLLQFAVDDPKLGFLTQIGWTGQSFVMNRIFDVTRNGMRINLKNYTKDMHLMYKGKGILNNLYKMFKYSPIRHGRTSSRDIASMAINLRNSRDIYKDYFSDKTLEEKAASVKNKLIKNTGLKAEQVKFEMNENVSPIESLLSELGRMYDDWRKENPDFVEAYEEMVDEDGTVIKQAENKNTPFHKQEDMYRILHNMATQDLILNIGDMLKEDEFAKARKSMKQKEDTKIAKEFKNELVKDFYTAFAQIAENKNKYGEVLSINYQYNEAFVRLTEKYEDRFNKMTPSQQMLSTIYFLATPYKQNKYVGQLPPIEILHWPTIVKYAEYFMKHELDVTKRTEGRLAEFKKAGTAINNATNILNMEKNNIINSVLGDCV